MVIVSAQILYLRLTIPADLYKSGVIAEVQGVQVCVNANFEDQCGVGKSKSTPPKKNHSEKPSKRVKADRPRNTQSHVHDPGGGFSQPSPHTGGDGRAGDSEYLPTTIDLAKSFLHDEPKEEKAELQDAIAKSRYLDQSLVNNDDGDETSGLGVANTLSLPGFLADFLKGVGDRVQVKVKDVELNLDVKLDVTYESSANSDTSERSNVLTIRFYIEDITVNATTHLATPSVTKQSSAQETPKSVSQEIRHIILTNFQIMLISEASLFANVTRSAGPSSPEITHASIVMLSGSKPTDSTVSSTITESKKTSSAFPASLDRQDSQGSDASMKNKFSQAATDSESPDAEHESTASLDLSNPGDSQYHDSVLTESFYSTSGDIPRSHEEAKDSIILPGSFLHGGAANYGSSTPLSITSQNSVDATSLEGRWTPPATFDAFRPTSLPAGNSQTELGFDIRSQGSMRPSISPAKLEDPGRSIGISAEALPSKSSSPDSHAISPVSEDLTQSKIFSHEEAESMYMSAISHVSAPRTDKSTSVPGQWSASSSVSSDEAKDSLFSGHLSSLQDKHTSISPQLETLTNKKGLASRHGDHGRRLPQIPNPETTEHVLPSSRLPIDARHEPVSPPGLSGQRYGSSQGSEASSANLKSPFTMMKRILSVDYIALKLSRGKPNTDGSAIGISYQSSAALSQTLSGSSGLTSQTNHTGAQEIPFSDDSSDSQQFDRQSSIDIDNVQVLSDMGLAKLMILVVEKMNAIRSISSSEKSRTAVPQPAPIETNQVRLNVKWMCWSFLDVVKGVPVKGSHSQLPVLETDLRGDSEVLLRAEMKELCATYRNSGPSSVLELLIRKFSFGYVSDDILSFDSGLKMRESTRDMLAPIDSDVKIIATKTISATKVELTTLPLHIALDSRRLDETFAWFGGFSSMLGLGSSMMSTMTVVDAAAKSSHHGRPIRAVHFEGQEQNSPTTFPPIQTQNKVTARIGGLVLDLQGTSSSLRLESTAMKLVSRPEGLGLQVDRLNISGPNLQHASSEASTAVKLSNLRIEYLSTPKEKDLDRLLALLSPSKDEYERDDDILLDTLLRQRRQGGVVRATVESLEGILSDLDDLQCFAALSEDFKKLSTVTKYLPEDDRPGILTLILVRDLRLRIQVNESFGAATLASKDLEAAHVAFPSLVALGITTLKLHRNDTEELVGHALPIQIVEACSPMVMARFIGNEMEPTAKIKLYNLRLEYHIPTLMAVMELKDAASVESVVVDMVSSVATLTTRATARGSTSKPSPQGPTSSDRSQGSKELRLDIAIRDSTLGLNPRKSPAKGLVVFTDTHFVGAMPRGEEADAVLDIRKASLMVIDDRDHVSPTAQSSIDRRSQVATLSELGYVTVSMISAAKATIHVVKLENDSSRAIDVDIRDDLFVLESCADSTQTIQSIIAGLTPPTPPSTELKYRTEVIPVEDMLASFSGDAFPASQTSDSTDEELPLGLDEGDMVDDEVPQNLEFVSSFYNPDLESVYEGIADSMLEDDIESLASSSVVREIGSKNRLESFEEQTQIAPDNSPLEFQDDHFGSSSVVEDTAHQRYNLPKTYALSDESRVRGSPLRVRVRDVHFIWNLYDGYDWQTTRNTISQAIEDVQNKATERLARNDKRKSTDPDEEEESVIGDFLFNSIYIGIPANRDPRDLAHQVNRNLDDVVSETESYATSTSSGSPSQKSQVPRSRGSRKLRLKRSKYHKMTFELKGVSADVTVFPPDSGDTQSSLDIRVQDLEIFDHVPTSTWKKFATYMQEAGERESGTDMIHLKILNVKPVPNLAASEIILKVRKGI